MEKIIDIAFTWAPNTTFHTTDPKIGYMMSILILKHLTICSKVFEIYPELTLNGNIHYHGIITINDKIKWYKSVLPKLKRNGYTCIKPINNKEHWYNYITKDWSTMNKVLDLDKPIEYEYLKKLKIKDIKSSQNIIDISYKS